MFWGKNWLYNLDWGKLAKLLRRCSLDYIGRYCFMYSLMHFQYLYAREQLLKIYFMLYKHLLTKGEFRIPADRYTSLWFSRLKPFEEILAVEINVRLKLLKSWKLGQTNYGGGLLRQSFTQNELWWLALFLFSNSLIIHDENTKEIPAVKEVWMLGFNLHRFSQFYSFVFSAFNDRFENLLDTKHLKECFVRYPNTSKSIKRN